MWIDSHCHLTHERIRDLGGPDELVRAARANSVEGMLTISCRIADEFPEILKAIQPLDGVWCTIGSHPHDCGRDAEKSVSLPELVRLALSDPKIVGIGESGLDYHYNYSSLTDQQESFRKHIRACLETDLPLVVHAREADEEIIRIIAEEGAGTSLRGVMHCFSSGRAMAEQALDLGFYISFSGMITFKAAEDLRAIARDIPLNRVLVETDSPFLAPEPHRGRANQPAYVAYTGAALAGIHGISPAEMARITTENFFRLFSRARPA